MNSSIFNLDNTLLIRALNATRPYYYPTYIGLRLIGDQLPKGDSDYLQRILFRRFNAGDTWRYKQFQIYKGSVEGPDGLVHEYRQCLAPSPLTAIAESLALALMAKDPDFSVSNRVYSYRWPPSSKSGSSYEFFANGYRQRSVEIASALEDENLVAVVTDIKSFYPSVQKDGLKEDLKKLLIGSSGTSKFGGEQVFEFYSQLLEASDKGIPIGPSSSHVLGHLALREVDLDLEGKYGNNYFRYVDDIVVVCHRSDQGKVEASIRESVESCGYSLNEDKTVVISGEEWHNNQVQADLPGDDDFRRFANDLAVYLAFFPDRKDGLAQKFSDAGLSIPMGRLFALSSYSRFRYFLSRRKAQQGLSNAISLVVSSNNDFLERASNLKSTYENTLFSLAEAPAESTPNMRRWQVQRVRRVVNSLFYLRNFSEWKASDSTFGVFPELVEQHALATALNSGAVDPVLPYYGRGPAAFSELWAEHGQGGAKLERTAAQLSPVEADGLMTLRLHGVLSEESILSSYDGKNARMLRAASRPDLSSRTNPDLTFEDEFESLRLGTSEKQIAELSRSRYSTSEATGLEALSLLTSEYRS